MFKSSLLHKITGISLVLWSALSCTSSIKSDDSAVLSVVGGKLKPFVLTEGSKSFINLTKGGGKAILNDKEWHCNVDYKKVPLQDNVSDVELEIYPTGKNIGATMGIEFDFANWSKENYVMIPASVYNGNRFKTVTMGWPRVIVDEKDRYHDIDPIIADHIPHLNINEGPSEFSIKLNDAAAPVIAFFSPGLQKGYVLQIKPTQGFDITVKENEARTQASFILASDGAPDVYNQEQTDTFSIAFRMYEFDGEHPIDLLANYFKVRKALTGPNEFVHSKPFSKIFEVQEWLHNNERWNSSTKNYIQAGLHEVDKFYGGVQLGWIGGLIEQQTLLTAGSKLSKDRSVQTMEHILNNMQAQTGLMYGLFTKGKLFSDDFRNPEVEPYLALARKNGDGLYYLLQEIMLLKNMDEYQSKVEPFSTKAKKMADGFVALWEKYGQFGQHFVPATGELVVYGSTSGASMISALALASEYFGEAKYLDVAKAAADFYYNRDLKNGYTTGGPGEAMQAPDSESSFAILEGFMALYELTQNKKYLGMAEHAAAYFSTWVTTYNFKFPDESPLGKADAKATGSVWANTLNRHGAPGICNASGDAILKLYRATNNPLYLELLKDIAHNLMQYVATEEMPLTPLFKPGYICERVNISNWEGVDRIGGNLKHSSPWVEVATMQTAVQIPSIYFDVEKSILTTFDHVEASIESTNEDEVKIKLKNPSQYDATYTVFLDTDKNTPMGWNNYAEFEKIELSANEEKVFTFNKF